MKLELYELEKYFNKGDNIFTVTYSYDKVQIIILTKMLNYSVESYSSYDGIKYRLELENPTVNNYRYSDTMSIIPSMNADVYEASDFKTLVARALSRLERGELHVVHSVSQETGIKTYNREVKTDG